MNNSIKYISPTWTHIEKLGVALYKRVRNDDFIPDIIAGISRGGLVPARILSDLYTSEGKKITLAIMQIGFYSGIGKTEKEPIIYQDLPGHIHGKKILLIDDVADSGVSLDFAVKYLNMKKPCKIKLGTLYYKPWSQLEPDYWIEKTTSWIIFPHERYEFMNLQLKEHSDLSPEEFKQFLITETGLPEYSIDLFISLKLENNSWKKEN